MSQLISARPNDHDTLIYHRIVNIGDLNHPHWATRFYYPYHLIRQYDGSQWSIIQSQETNPMLSFEDLEQL